MSEARRQRLWQFGAATAFVAILAVVAIVVSSSGSSSLKHLDEDRATVRKLFDGIPQQGQTLGDAQARATLLEFADLQCPFCRSFTLDDLPEIIARYVKPGDLQIRFEPQTIIGPQSDEAARAALAAGEQDRLWQFADLFYRNQDDENSGYVTDEFIRTLFENTPGVNVGEAVNDLGSAGVGDSLSRSKNAFDRLGLSATPTFVLVHQGQESDPFGAGEVQSKLEAALP